MFLGGRKKRRPLEWRAFHAISIQKKRTCQSTQIVSVSRVEFVHEICTANWTHADSEIEIWMFYTGYNMY
jgi:hypothetical protein